MIYTCISDNFFGQPPGYFCMITVAPGSIAAPVIQNRQQPGFPEELLRIWFVNPS